MKIGGGDGGSARRVLIVVSGNFIITNTSINIVISQTRSPKPGSS